MLPVIDRMVSWKGAKAVLSNTYMYVNRKRNLVLLDRGKNGRPYFPYDSNECNFFSFKFKFVSRIVFFLVVYQSLVDVGTTLRYITFRPCSVPQVLLSWNTQVKRPVRFKVAFCLALSMAQLVRSFTLKPFLVLQPARGECYYSLPLT